MADPVADTLLSLAQSFSVAQTPGADAFKFSFDLLGPADAKGNLSIVENLLETVVKDSPIDLSFILKDVRFGTSPITDQDPVGGQPIVNLLTPGLTQTDVSGFTKPGIAGELAALTGTIPLPLQQMVAHPLTVAFQVRWSVLDENGNPAADVSWTLGTSSGDGGIIPVQDGASILPLALAFNPTVVELVLGTPLTAKRTVRVSICLTAKTAANALRATTGWLDLPPIELVLPVIAVPVIALFFSGKFSGDLLIAVPNNSTLPDETATSGALDTLNTLLSTAGTALTIGSFFIDSLGDIKHALSVAGKKKFLKADGCKDLHSVKFAGASLTDWNGEDGDDHFTSLMLIAPPHRSVECFNDTSYDTGEGQLILRAADDLFAQIEDLDHKVPTSEPADLVRVPHWPSGWRPGSWHIAHHITSFANEFSSYRFAWW